MSDKELLQLATLCIRRSNRFGSDADSGEYWGTDSNNLYVHLLKRALLDAAPSLRILGELE